LADFSTIDVEKLFVALKEEEALWYSYLDLPFSVLLVRHDMLQKYFFVFYPRSCPAVPLKFPLFQ
jgi:hypothetical protein